MASLSDADLQLKLSERESQERILKAQRRLLALRLQLGGLIGGPELGPPLCVLFEGWDASGKGGSIRRLVSPLDPPHVRVTQFGAPTADERRHHFLHRFSQALAGGGGMAVLDRSWYGRVLVERVEGLATEHEWRRAYPRIVQWESGLATEGTVRSNSGSVSPRTNNCTASLPRPRARPPQTLEADRRGLAQPLTPRRLRRSRRRDARLHRSPSDPVACSRSRVQALRTRART